MIGCSTACGHTGNYAEEERRWRIWGQGNILPVTATKPRRSKTWIKCLVWWQRDKFCSKTTLCMSGTKHMASSTALFILQQAVSAGWPPNSSSISRKPSTDPPGLRLLQDQGLGCEAEKPLKKPEVQSSISASLPVHNFQLFLMSSPMISYSLAFPL